MPLIEKRVFMAKCDGCGEIYELDDFVPYYESVAQAADELSESDWVVGRGDDPVSVHCSDCAPLPDDDEEGGDVAPEPPAEVVGWAIQRFDVPASPRTSIGLPLSEPASEAQSIDLASSSRRSSGA